MRRSALLAGAGCRVRGGAVRPGAIAFAGVQHRAVAVQDGDPESGEVDDALAGELRGDQLRRVAAVERELERCQRGDRRGRVLRLWLDHPRDQLRGDPGAVVGVGERARVRLLRAAHEQKAADPGDHERGEDDPTRQQAAGKAASQAEPADEQAAAPPTGTHGSSLLGERRRRMGDRSQSGNGPVTNDLECTRNRAFSEGPRPVRLGHALSPPPALASRHG